MSNWPCRMAVKAQRAVSMSAFWGWMKCPNLAVSGGCWFVSQGAHIHLGVEEGFTPSRKAHPALLVHNLAALITRLEKCGVPYSAGKPLEGYIRGDIADPFGNRIELMERI